MVSGDVRHPFSFEIYIALGSTHGPEFFPLGFISGLRDRLVYGSGSYTWKHLYYIVH